MNQQLSTSAKVQSSNSEQNLGAHVCELQNLQLSTGFCALGTHLTELLCATRAVFTVDSVVAEQWVCRQMPYKRHCLLFYLIRLAEPTYHD